MPGKQQTNGQYNGPQFMILFGKEVDIIHTARAASGLPPRNPTIQEFEIVLSELLLEYRTALLTAGMKGGLESAQEISEHRLEVVETEVNFF